MITATVSDILGDAASVATVLAAIGGSVAALFYGRKANATVTAAAQRLPDRQVLLSARPSVQVAGLFGLSIRDPEASTVTVKEVLNTPDRSAFGKEWKQRAVFGGNTVGPGETLTTSVLFELGSPRVEVVG